MNRTTNFRANCIVIPNTRCSRQGGSYRKDRGSDQHPNDTEVYYDKEESFGVFCKGCNDDPGKTEEFKERMPALAKYYKQESILMIYGKDHSPVGEFIYTDGRPPERVTRASFGLGVDYESSIPAEAFIEECESLDYTFNRGGRRLRLERVSGPVCSPVRAGPGELRRALSAEEAEELLKPLRYKGEKP